MDAPRLRRTVSVLAIAATAGSAVAIGANPLPDAAPETTTAASAGQGAAGPVADDASLAQREARAAARLALAEQRLRALASQAAVAASAPVVPAPAPVVSVAPASSAPVTQSASS